MSGSLTDCSQSRNVPSGISNVRANSTCVSPSLSRIRAGFGTGRSSSISSGVSGGLSGSASAFASISSSVMAARRARSVRSTATRRLPSGSSSQTVPFESSSTLVVRFSLTTSCSPGRYDPCIRPALRADDSQHIGTIAADDYTPHFIDVLRKGQPLHSMRVSEHPNGTVEVHPMLDLVGFIFRLVPFVWCHAAFIPYSTGSQ